MTEHRAPDAMTVRDLFGDDRRYRVPVYQRAYAWTTMEVETLLADVRQARIQAQEGSDYYLGSLVVDRVRQSDGTELDEVVDGQQRLTTLTVLLSVAGRHFPEVISVQDLDPVHMARLEYEGRPDAAHDLGQLRSHAFAAGLPWHIDAIEKAADTVDRACRAGADLAPGVTSSSMEGDDPVFEAADLAYLLEHVRLLRTELPAGTDLNHYFEVMNTRGEQLEKHEILKARLLEPLGDPTDRHVFARVWDTCARLDRHVQVAIAGGTSTRREREELFGGDWDRLAVADFRDLRAALAPTDSEAAQMQSPAARTLGALLAGSRHVTAGDKDQAGTDVDDVDDGSYGALVDFPNLLLHVLRVTVERDAGTQRHEVWGDDTDDAVRLDDKFLLEEFQRAGYTGEGGPDAQERSQRFIVELLRLRLLMDTYVIRTLATSGTQDDQENWVLRRAGRQQGQKERLGAISTFSDADVQRSIRNLQAMFQVTDTRRTSKHFLYRILRWLRDQDGAGEVDGRAFRTMLEDLARQRLRTYAAPVAQTRTADDAARSPLDCGVQVPNFVFNVLDYALWVAGTGHDDALLAHLADVERPTLIARAPHFRFRYRTSVEHFYPVVPGEGQRALSDKDVNLFGNLCIMGRRENSQRNNLMPSSKAVQYMSEEQSLKFQLMELVLKAEDAWEEPQIEAHGCRMLAVLEAWRDRRPHVESAVVFSEG